MSDQRKLRGNRTQEKLIQAVLELAAEHGLSGISASKLAKHAGVSTSTIFHHFSSIEELSLAAMRNWFDAVMDSIDSPQHAPQTLEGYLASLGDATFAMTQDSTSFRATMAFLHHGLYEPKYAETLAPFLDLYAQKQQSRLAELTGLSVEDPQVISWSAALSALLDGLSLQVSLNGDQEGYRQAWEAVTQAMQNAFSAPNPKGEVLQ